jgi:hypothetical protein
MAWKTAQHFSYGARGFMRVPVSEANDLNYLLAMPFFDFTVFDADSLQYLQR